MAETIAEQLEALYERYNRRAFVSPDPVEFLYRYDDPADREIAALVASSLAYGRVRQINGSVAAVFGKTGPSPSRFLRETPAPSLRRAFSGFRHRFTSGNEMADMLLGVRAVVEEYGSLGACFSACCDRRVQTVREATDHFVQKLCAGFAGCRNSLLPSPAKGSSCKRLHLFLRWMVRRDDIDPGGWDDIPASALIIPLDTHMHRVCLGLGLTKRRQADIKTALEITDAFRGMVPHDPVRYDFILTRPGIWKNAGLDFPADTNILNGATERMNDEA